MSEIQGFFDLITKVLDPAMDNTMFGEMRLETGLHDGWEEFSFTNDRILFRLSACMFLQTQETELCSQMRKDADNSEDQLSLCFSTLNAMERQQVLYRLFLLRILELFPEADIHTKVYSLFSDPSNPDNSWIIGFKTLE